MKKILPAIAAAALLMTSLAHADHARSTGFSNSFDGHIVFCPTEVIDLGTEILPNGLIRREFVNIGNLWITDNELLNGVEENHVVATFEPGPPPPTGTIEIDGTTVVDAVEGAWRFRQIIFVTPEEDRGYGFGIGTGDLRGKLILFRSAKPEFLRDTPCGPTGGAPISGRIITFGWRF